MMLLDIQCPNCSSILSVPQVPDMERKFVTCPACKQRSRFRDFKVVDKDVSDGGTQVGLPEELKLENTVIGQIVDDQNPGHPYKLKEGSNVIGRQATTSKADMQFVAPQGDNRISREHLLIEVSNVKGKGFVHNISLYKEKVNETSVNGSPLLYPEKITLKDGDKIQLPGKILRFEIPNPDATVYTQN